MIHIRIIAIGKLKESFWKDTEAEYLKRLRPYAKIDIIEVKEEAFREHDKKETIKEKEAQLLTQYISAADMVVALHETGKEMTSIQFATWLDNETNTGKKITFIIGGPLGLDPGLLETIPMQLSLSQYTFPHQMVRTILLEQLYRAITISMGKQYHY